jgi:hypothetical protein
MRGERTKDGIFFKAIDVVFGVKYFVDDVHRLLANDVTRWRTSTRSLYF